MPPMMGPMIGQIGVDAIYSFVIIFTSLLIYFGTRELYELSNHKGIRYFRLTFLFFALAYLFRFLTQFIFISLGHPRTPQSNLGLISLISLVLFMYASTTAIFYLWASSQSKFFRNKKYSTAILHIVAIVISILGILTNNTKFLLAIQAAIVITLAITTYKKDQNKKSAQPIYILYTLLAIFWMLNIVDIILPNFFQTTQLLVYILSLSTFILMLYKVIKKTGP